MGEISKKVWERKLNSREGMKNMKRMRRMDVEGRRRKGRPKWRWMDNINVDLREKGLSGEETQNRPHIEVGNNGDTY